MINQKKYPLFAMILACACIASAAQEPNQYTPQLKFETDSKELPYEKDGKAVQSPIRPTYATEFFLFDPMCSFSGNQQELARILDTTSGQSLSQQQKDFLTVTDTWFSFEEANALPYHYRIHLYAVSEKDSRKMTEAFIESVMSKNNAMARTEERMNSLHVEILSIQRDIEKYEADLVTKLAKFREDVNNAHYLTVNEAEKAISELNKMLNNLSIDMAGMEAKIKEMQRTEENLRHSGARNQQDRLVVLEQMRIEQGIELSIANAKKESAIQLRTQAEEFCRKMNAKQFELKQQIGKLQNEKTLIELQELNLFHETSNIQFKRTAEVYGNGVKIHPVAEKQ